MSEDDLRKPKTKPRRGLWSSMRRLFTGDDEAAAAEETEKHSGPMEGEEDHWVPLTLEELLRNQPDAEVHIITLGQFRGAIGPTWERVAQKVLMIAEATLRRMAGPGNIVKQTGGDLFLLAFPRLSPEEGRRRAFAAAVELGQKLVGAKFKIVDGGSGPAICIASGKGGALLDEGGGLNLGAITALGDQAAPVGQTTKGMLSPQAHKGDSHDPALGTIEPPGSAYEENTWQKLEREKREAQIRLVPIEPPQRKKRPEPEWVTIPKKK